MARIKNWEKFQHYKGRRPPWIKIHREVLDDFAINALTPEAFKFLIQLWLLASESENGEIPQSEVIAYRLRMNENKVVALLKQVSSFVLADCKQNGVSEVETETEEEEETETEARTSLLEILFDKFWEAYPKKKSKGDAEKAWSVLKPNEQLVETMISTIERAKTSAEWRKDGGQYVPYPATWLRAKGWLDEFTASGQCSILDAPTPDWILNPKFRPDGSIITPESVA